ncbi:MAG: cytochrome c oxidase accessory protein CcoG [Bdellovibrionaceae bacterium]|nr:cytochrome c oxidase accessory protein CcoG [Pseudobdellovibrionaceae bacterium]
MSSLGLDPDRLSSLDEHGHRRFIIPGEVRGAYRRARTKVQGVLILIFLLLPWLTINGRQALLLDIGSRRFLIFGLELYAHDAPLIFFILAFLAIGLAFVTAVWGRAWCGWACPQTVFIDGLFRRIEVWVEGGYIERRRMAQAPMTVAIFKKRVLKWALFLAVSSLIAHSFAAYFVGADRIIRMMTGSPFSNWSYFLLISSFTAVILFDFAWFREQFCIIMCPYGRFQGLLMDRRSLAVVYDEKRGEPRRGTLPKPARVGDCVACNRCVEVCPTGIDIRKGVQMECIACTACVDACDEIMEKVKKPKGLIKIDSLAGGGWTLKSPRSWLYLGLLVVLSIGLSVSLFTRSRVDMVILRAPGELYQRIDNAPTGANLMNHLRLHLKNQTGRPLRLRASAQKTSSLELPLTTPVNPFDLAPGEDQTVHVFISFPDSILDPHGESAITITLQDENDPDLKIEKPFRLLGPAR